MHADLYIARKSVHALRDLIILHADRDVEPLHRLRRLVSQASAAIGDPQANELLNSVLRYAEDLYSPDGPAKWERPRMSGVNYLKLQILSKLAAFQNRLSELETMRDIELQAGMTGSSPSAGHDPLSFDTRH